MESYHKELWFEAPKRRQLINITPQVEACVRESGVRKGLALCNAMNLWNRGRSPLSTSRAARG